MFVTILSRSRHHPSQVDDAAPSSAANLACATLDTLLCILVDCPQIIRAFEDVDGVETIVKLLKRSGTARSVRCVYTPSIEACSLTRYQDEVPRISLLLSHG